MIKTCTFIGAAALAVAAIPACKKKPSPKKAAAGEKGTVASFDHAAFSRLLRRHVDAQGRVSYHKWLQSEADKKALAAYLSKLAAAKAKELAPPAALAFWINAYNAFVLHGVMKQLPTKADFSVSNDGFKFFDEVAYTAGGIEMSLNELENGLIRGDWGHKSLKKTPAKRLTELKALHHRSFRSGQKSVDPRIHFGLVCASVGCPNLRQEAFVGARLDKQLDEQTRGYVNDAAKGASAKGISSIFHWFAKDFKAADGSVQAFIEKHYKGDASKLSYKAQISYSWKLNAQ